MKIDDYYRRRAGPAKHRGMTALLPNVDPDGLLEGVVDDGDPAREPG